MVESSQFWGLILMNKGRLLPGSVAKQLQELDHRNLSQTTTPTSITSPFSSAPPMPLWLPRPPRCCYDHYHVPPASSPTPSPLLPSRSSVALPRRSLKSSRRWHLPGVLMRNLRVCLPSWSFSFGSCSWSFFSFLNLKCLFT